MEQLHFIRHVSYEGLGHIRPWAEVHGFQISETRPYAGEAFPAPSTLGMLVVLGGPMGACDEDRYPWIAREKRFLEQALRAETPTLAICLGAQLMADVLGAEVRRNPQAEIGWHTIESVAEADALGATDVLTPFFTPGVEVLQWHYDTFDLPAGAVHLARSEACEQQAYSWGDHLVAVQFHPEMTWQEVATLVERDAPLPAGEYVSDPAALLDAARFDRMEEHTHGFLERLVSAWFGNGETPRAPSGAGGASGAGGTGGAAA